MLDRKSNWHKILNFPLIRKLEAKKIILLSVGLPVTPQFGCFADDSLASPMFCGSLDLPKTELWFG